MTCKHEHDIEIYHDGELDDAAATAIENHLFDCAVCAARLAHLRHVTERFEVSLRRFELEMPSDFTMRLHHEVDELMEGGVLRLAMSFASVAAVVLIAATIGLVQLQHPTTQAPQSWESAAMAMDSSSNSGGVSSSLASASTSSFEPDVILADLSRKGTH